MLELLGMVLTALLFVTPDARPSYARDPILMREDNMSAVQLVSKCRGEREPRSGGLMSLLGVWMVAAGGLTRYTSLVWRTPSLTAFHDGSRKIPTVSSTRSGPTLLGTDRY